jgi:tryptophanase
MSSYFSVPNFHHRSKPRPKPKILLSVVVVHFALLHNVYSSDHINYMVKALKALHHNTKSPTSSLCVASN